MLVLLSVELRRRQLTPRERQKTNKCVLVAGGDHFVGYWTAARWKMLLGGLAFGVGVWVEGDGYRTLVDLVGAGALEEEFEL
jgi:hypothetical protein